MCLQDEFPSVIDISNPLVTFPGGPVHKGELQLALTLRKVAGYATLHKVSVVVVRIGQITQVGRLAPYLP
jgi:hypothetical protein